jgi:flavin-dependent dehydrogenase
VELLDALVIGGGPTGATLAGLLARRGRRVLVVEKERFPRFHIGESLLPASIPLLHDFGVKEKLEAAGFLRKYAAEFVTADGALTRRYPFAEGVVDGFPHAYEVDRAEFDAILIDHARELGADVRHGLRVTEVDFDDRDVVRVGVRDDRGNATTFSTRMVLDASGQNAFLASRFRLRRMDRKLQHFAVFSHFEAASRASGEREGDITIVLVPGGWWWVIPLAGGKTSVGLVGPSRLLGGEKPDEDFLTKKLAATPYLERRFSGAQRVAPVRTVSDYSYVCRRFTGDRWVLVGDAAAFIDPVFSTGVHLGLSGAFRAAAAAERNIAAGTFSARRFRGYERWLKRALRSYRRFVAGFYLPEFAEVMMHPSDRLLLRQAVTSLLGGYGVGHFGVTWRIAIFRTITRLNRRWSLTPRLPGRRDATAF